jgi:hypothetical protein
MTSTPAAPPSVVADVPYWPLVRRDLSRLTALRFASAVAMTAWIIFQWGFGNDALLPVLVARTGTWIDDETTLIRLVLATTGAGLVGLLFWAVTQTIDAVVVIAGADLMPNTVARLSAGLRRRGWVKPWAELSWVDRWLIAYGAGASAAVLVDALATGRPGLHGRRSMVASAVALSSGSVGLVSFVITGLALSGLRFPSTEPAARRIIAVVSSPLFWLAVLSAVFIGSRLRHRLRTHRAPTGLTAG